MAKLQRQDGVAAQALAFTILTAARSSETIGMTWREIDRDKRVWKIPSSRTKSGTSHMVTLSEAASAVLDARRTGDAQPDDYVFEGPKGGPLSNMSMLMLLRRMQYGAITVHWPMLSVRRQSGPIGEIGRCENVLTLWKHGPAIASEYPSRCGHRWFKAGHSHQSMFCGTS